MLVKTFPQSLATSRLEAHAGMVESSRFCVDTSLPDARGGGALHNAALTLFSAIIEWSMTHGYREIVIRNAITSRLIVVISGGSELGKTTLANAVIAEIVETAPDDRILLILEDTAEMQCAAENAVALHTSDAIETARLLKSTMRFRPDRIVGGEVRDGAALTLLKASNTGFPA
jgi:type IV secretion system protein VirB11